VVEPQIENPPPVPDEQPAKVDSPFVTSEPEFLPMVPAVPPKSGLTLETTEPLAQPPVDLFHGEAPQAERPAGATPAPVPHTAAEPEIAPVKPPTTFRTSTPGAGQSALSPDAQRHVESAAADRKDQQRRESLKRPEGERRPKPSGRSESNQR